MGLSPPQCTKEFKLAALQRLDSGASIAEVAGGASIRPSVVSGEKLAEVLSRLAHKFRSLECMRGCRLIK